MLLAPLLVAQLTAKRAGMWDLSVRYPRFSAGGPVARAANAESRLRERRAFGAFLAQARNDMPGLKRQGTAGSYELDVTPHRITDRPGLASGYVERYGYTAGAHGSTSYDAIDVGRIGGQVRPFGLRDLFRPGGDAVAQASQAIVEVLKAGKAPVPSDVASGEWKGLTKERSWSARRGCCSSSAVMNWDRTWRGRASCWCLTRSFRGSTGRACWRRSSRKKERAHGPEKPGREGMRADREALRAKRIKPRA